MKNKVTYKLMIKIHRKTKLKYLCMTKKNDYKKYTGSGKYWKLHLKVHGKDIKTILIFETESEEELAKVGLYFSKKYNIVESDDWANLKFECGYDGDPDVGYRIGRSNYHRKIGIHDPKYKHLKVIWSKKGGVIGGKKTRENKSGIFSGDWDRSAQSIKNYENGIGFSSIPLEDKRKNGRIGGSISRDMKLGIFGASKEDKTRWAKENGSLGGIRCRDEKLGMFKRTRENFLKDCSDAGKIGGKVVGSMLWWNNGQINKKSNECPGEGFVRGQLKKSKGK
jgi:hypothetical protein